MIKKIITPLIWLLFLALFLPQGLWAQDDKAQIQQPSKHVVQARQLMRGTIVDENGQPLPGAKVQLVGRVPKYKVVSMAVTDADGRFSLDVKDAGMYVVVEYVGFKTYETRVRKNTNITIQLTPDEHELKETVVTGFYSKAKNSFTGTAVQVGGDELRSVNNTSFFNSLKVFEPSLQVVDTRGMFGSDPNHVPGHIELRGQNSMPDISRSELETQTSLPVFILDGFEVSVQKVYDLDMNRIKSVTILKDASASAIYGSRAANGVIVIETRNPEAGKLQISYTLNGGIQVPDLTSYNLMNASEALEFQKAAGVFDPYTVGEDGGANLNSYYAVLRNVMNGVDTYWLKKPLRMGFNRKHTVMIDGSVLSQNGTKGNVRYSVNLGMGMNDGAMKGSTRTTYEAGTKLMFQTRKLYITNNLQFSLTNSADSPYGNFSTYTRTLPYYQECDADGNYYRLLSIANFAPSGMALGVLASQQSPVYEAKYLNSFSKAEVASVTNNLSINWLILPELRLKGSFSLSYDFSRNDAYVSPASFAYINNNDNSSTNPDVLYRRGRYNINNSSGITYNANTVVSYTRSWGKLDWQAILGAEARQITTDNDGYAMTGFLGDAQNYLSYAVQYERFGRVNGLRSTVRTAGVFSNQNLSWDNRYLMDMTCRLDGSSLYGKHERSSSYWSVGFRWNISNEKFLRGNKNVQNLALRLNVGTTGSQSYNRNQASNMYTYTRSVYGGFFGAIISTLGNPELRGQRTYNRNIGLDGSFFGNKLNFELNYYYNTTKGNLTTITIAPSIGFNSYKANMGDLTNRGYEFSLSYTPVKTKKIMLNLSFNGAHNTNRIRKISDFLKRYNDTVNSQAQSSSTPTTVFLFTEGQSMNTIYTVPSLGIDPGTGKEIFVNRDKTTTYTWQASNQVPVGVNEPSLRGYIGVNFRYGNWEMGTHAGYSFGADKYNYTLAEKIENVNYMVNNDRRALTERWQKPGSIAHYKAIRDNSVTKATSRFVQKERYLSLASLRLSYMLPRQRLLNNWVSMLKLSVTANDLFYLSSIRQERGLSYPFTRSVTFSALINF
ncbi:MAG: SusC/RagA family TonB-linked outer membrane protein [Prevotella sp.]